MHEKLKKMLLFMLFIQLISGQNNQFFWNSVQMQRTIKISLILDSK